MNQLTTDFIMSHLSFPDFVLYTILITGLLAANFQYLV